MVDFQKRDTSRVGGDDSDEEQSGESGEADAAEADSGAADVDTSGEVADHDHHAADLDELGFAVLTISSSRASTEDPAGDAIDALLSEAGHEVAIRELVGDDYDGIQSTVERLLERADVDAIVTAGGTGVTPDDVTIEALDPLLEKVLPGFGELFRALSREEIGTRVVGTRAMAGVVDGVPVFALPGSEHAARLGTEEIILEEAGHLAGLAGRH